jgi:hypothetical protein
MNRKEKIEKILKNLKKYESKNLPISKYSIQKLNVRELDKLEEIFFVKSTKILDVGRPICPSKNIDELNKARKDYRIQIHKYISEYGYGLENPFYINIPVYESIANFLDSKR